MVEGCGGVWSEIRGGGPILESEEGRDRGTGKSGYMEKTET